MERGWGYAHVDIYIYIFRERERDIYILVYKFIKDVVKYFGLDSFLIDVLSIPSFGPAM